MDRTAFDQVTRRTIPLEELELTDAERALIMANHQPIYSESQRVFDQGLGAVVSMNIPLPSPLCLECRQPWGKNGCPTYRAALLMRVYAERHAEHGRRVTELEYALSDRFSYTQRVRAGQDVLEIAICIDRGSLLLGGINIIRAQLVQIEKHWRKWFKEVGDQQRIRENPIHELAMDTDRVMFLREFRAAADFEKPAGEPWTTR